MATARWRLGGEVAKDGDKIVYSSSNPMERTEVLTFIGAPEGDLCWRLAGEWTDDNRLETPPGELGVTLIEGERKK